MAGQRSAIGAGQGGERALDVDDEGRPVLQPDQIWDQQPAGLTRTIRADREQVPVTGVAVFLAGQAPVAGKRLVGVLGRNHLVAEIDPAIGRPEVFGHRLRFSYQSRLPRAVADRRVGLIVMARYAVGALIGLCRGIFHLIREHLQRRPQIQTQNPHGPPPNDWETI